MPTTTTVSARVVRAATVSDSLYKAAVNVEVRLVADGYDETRTMDFALRFCEFTEVPIGVSYTITFKGIASGGRVLWTGSASGTTAASGTRGAVTSQAVVTVASSADSLLSDLKIDGESLPGFVPGNAHYSIQVSSTAMSVSVAATARNDADVASITCNGNVCGMVALEGAAPSISVVVRNWNGKEFTYTISVTRTATPEPTDTTLSALKVNGVMVRGFLSGATTYADSVPAGTQNVLVTPVSPNESSVLILCNDKTCSDSVALSADPTVIRVSVKNQKGQTLVYTINLYRRSPSSIPRDSTLASLKINGKSVAGFDRTKFDYMDSVDANISGVLVDAVPNVAGDVDTILCNDGGCGYVDVPRDTVVTITVVNLNGRIASYTVDIRHRKVVPVDGVPWNGGISYDTLVDDRDGHAYRTVTIGSQTWMAENLAYSDGGMFGVCPGDSGLSNGPDDSCAKYGRLYAADEVALLSTNVYLSKLSYSSVPVQGICPTGWHVPSEEEWLELEYSLGLDVMLFDSLVHPMTLGVQLMAKGSWKSDSGQDTKGFRVLAAGIRGYQGVLAGLGTGAAFWTSSYWGAAGALYLSEDDGSYYTWARVLEGNGALIRAAISRSNKLSVRCVEGIAGAARSR